MSKAIIGVITAIVVGIMLTATGWNFKATAEMPKTYVLKVDHNEDIDRIDKKLDIIIRHLIEDD
jgi:hypothetical protein